MDTAPAAVLGATFDPQVRRKRDVLVANLGNFHTLAFRLGESGIEGVFEHHTGLLNRQKLEALLLALADGSLTRQFVFEDQGHGALVFNNTPFPMGTEDFNLAVTGPRRNILSTDPSLSTGLRPYFAVPFGDMMIAGCFGLLAAVADQLPDLSDQISRSLQGLSYLGSAPWDA